MRIRIRSTRRAPILRTASVWIATALFVLAGGAPASADTTVRDLDATLDTGSHRSVGFHGSVGEVNVVGVSGGQLSVAVELRCSRSSDDDCRQAAEDVDLRVRRRGDRIEVDIEDWPKLHNKRLSLRARLEVPRDLQIEIDMGVAEIAVEGMENDVEIDVGVGEVSIDVQESAFRSINLDAGVGEVVLHAGGRTYDGTGFVGSHLEWRDGPGRAHVEVDTGVGEIDVTLR